MRSAFSVMKSELRGTVAPVSRRSCSLEETFIVPPPELNDANVTAAVHDLEFRDYNKLCPELHKVSRNKNSAVGS